MRDLFGNEVSEEEARRQLKRKSPEPQGYAARPGTGPEGETCGSCRHLVRRQWGRVYLKCGLMERHWTHGRGSDIKARAPACRNWEPPGRDATDQA